MLIRSALCLSVGVLFCASGCASSGGTTAQQQLQTAQLAFTAAEGIVTVLEATNVIKPSAATQISPLESAAVAALAKASADVATGQGNPQTSLDALNSAVAAYSQAIVQSKTAAATFGSETILTMVTDLYGIKVTDQINVNRVDVYDPRLLLGGGTINSQLIINYPTDPLLQAYVKAALKAFSSNVTFSDDITG